MHIRLTSEAPFLDSNLQIELMLHRSEDEYSLRYVSKASCFAANRGKQKVYAENGYDCWDIGSVVGVSFLHACQTFCCFAKYWIVYSHHFLDCPETEVRERYGRTPRSSATCRTTSPCADLPVQDCFWILPVRCVSINFSLRKNTGCSIV